MPFAVRPDMLGVAFQTVGVLLVVSALGRDAAQGWKLSAGFVVFALALCVKQHFITCPLISTGLALAQWRRGRLELKLIERSIITGLAVGVACYGIEELWTGGRMSQAVFRAAAAASRVHPGGWFRAYLLLFSITGRSSGLVMLVVAAGLAGLTNRTGWGWKGLTIAGTGLIGLFLALSVRDFSNEAEERWELVLALLAVVTTMCIALPACVILARRLLARQWLDRVLLVYLAGELVMIVVLGWSSTGSWANYGIQATVFTSVIAARALDRACALRLSARAMVPIAAALSLQLFGVCSNTWSSFHRSRAERAALEQILGHFGRPSTEYFFVGRPGENRVHGRSDLVYDDWLYPVFESIRLAEPRSAWLRRALTDGSIRFIVNTSEMREIDGLAEPLALLGFVRRVKNGPFFVWERIIALAPN
jgi:hypothetical protein